MGDYNSNIVINYLKKNSKIEPEESKTTESIYLYWKNYSFRYSKHKKVSSKVDQFNIIYFYSPRGFLIQFPGKEDYNWYSEKETYSILRRLNKKEKREERKRKDPQKRKKSRIIRLTIRIRREKKRLKNIIKTMIEDG